MFMVDMLYLLSNVAGAVVDVWRRVRGILEEVNLLIEAVLVVPIWVMG